MFLFFLFFFKVWKVKKAFKIQVFWKGGKPTFLVWLHRYTHEIEHACFKMLCSTQCCIKVFSNSLAALGFCLSNSSPGFLELFESLDFGYFSTNFQSSPNLNLNISEGGEKHFQMNLNLFLTLSSTIIQACKRHLRG